MQGYSVQKRNTTAKTTYWPSHRLGDFSTSLSPNRHVIQKNTKQRNADLTDNINQNDLIKVYKLFYLNTKEYTISLVPHEPFLKTDHIYENKECLNEYKIQQIQNEITTYKTSDHCELKLDINRKSRRHTKSLLWNNSLLNKKKESRQKLRKIKNFLEQNENEITTYTTLSITIKAFLRGEFIALHAYILKMEISYSYFNSTPESYILKRNNISME